MKRTLLYSLIFIVLMFSNAMAYDWESAGLKVKETGTIENENFIILNDSAGSEIKVRYTAELSDDWCAKIIRINKNFREWKYMHPDKMEFFVNGSTLEILILPSQFNYSGLDFMPYIPGGMTFINDYELRYNFRVNRDNYFLRLAVMRILSASV